MAQSSNPITFSEMELAFARGASKSRTDPWASEILPGSLFLGNRADAQALDMFQVFEVHAVINAAPQDVKTGAHFYPAGIEYMEIADLEDDEDETIAPHFEVCAAFIHRHIVVGRKVLVHCRAGVSRSASIVLAYLVKHGGMSFSDAIRHVQSKRAICPNRGFFEQLKQFEVCEKSMKSQTALT